MQRDATLLPPPAYTAISYVKIIFLYCKAYDLAKKTNESILWLVALTSLGVLSINTGRE